MYVYDVVVVIPKGYWRPFDFFQTADRGRPAPHQPDKQWEIPGIRHSLPWEGEERIWSNKEYHPFKNLVAEIHIHYNLHRNSLSDNLIKVIGEKIYPIPIWFYDNTNNYLLHRKDKAFRTWPNEN